ncbi:MAG: amidase family protein [Microthrixaceae bacterium]
MGRISEQVAAISGGEMTSVEATEAAIARIEAGDGALNAVVVRDFDRALVAAAESDRRRAAGERPPLLGLPMTVKEAFDVEGLPTTWGLTEAADHIATEDAKVVQRLRAAGAVILGKTNVPPSLSDHQSSNPVYGVTHNPHGHGRSPGGSSGGAAAAVAAGFVVAEVGSDIGGSIRVPAAFCGIWGLKPTYGLIDKDGHYMPGFDSHSDELSVAGPIATSADDLDLLVGVLADHPVFEPRFGDLAGVRVAALADEAGVPISAEVRGAFEQCLESFESAGAVVDRSPALPDVAAIQGEYVQMLLTIMGGGIPPVGQEPKTVRNWFDHLDEQARTRRAWTAALDVAASRGGYDAVLSPVFSTTAFPVDESDLLTRQLDIDGELVPALSQLVWASVPIYAGLPSVVFPAGMGSDGLPIGLQLMGAHHRDRELLALASHVAQPVVAPPGS